MAENIYYEDDIEDEEEQEKSKNNSSGLEDTEKTQGAPEKENAETTAASEAT